MTDLIQRLADEFKIPQASRLRVGENYRTCPRCSAGRKPENRKKECLSVKLDHDGGAVIFCHNCSWTDNIPVPRDPGTGRRPPPRPEQPKDYKPARAAPLERFRPPQMYEFFERRGIGAETVDAFDIDVRRIQYPQDPKGKTTAAMAFPFRLRGTTRNHKYRDKDKRFAQDPKTFKTLFNVDALIDNDAAIWCEGEPDVMACHEAGMPNAVSLPEGAPPVPQEPEALERAYEIDHGQARYVAIANCASELATIKKHIIAIDDDGPGRIFAHQIIHRLGPDRCWRVKFPKGCKDPNDVLMQYGPERLREVIEKARRIPHAGLREYFDDDELVDFRRSPRQEKFGLGLPAMDEQIMWRRRQLVLVSGVPGDGKSSMVDWMCVRLAELHGWRTVFFSPEHERESHAGALIEKHTGLLFKGFRPDDHTMSDGMLREGTAWLNEYFSWIEADREDRKCDLEYVLEQAYAAVLRDRPQILVLDPYNEIYHEYGRLTQADYVAQFMQKLNRFAEKNDLLIVLVAHPAKMMPARDGKRPKPTPYDVAGGANFFNKCKIAMTVWRPKVGDGNTGVEVLIWKVKDKYQGRPGNVSLKWERETGRYAAGTQRNEPEPDASQSGFELHE